MGMNSEPFTPGGTVSRSVSGTTARVALAKGSVPQTVMVTGHPTGAIAFIKFGDSTVEAAATDTPILPGAIYTLSISAGVTHVAAIGTSGTLYFTSGRGA